jgi:hypothetical protein
MGSGRPAETLTALSQDGFDACTREVDDEGA